MSDSSTPTPNCRTCSNRQSVSGACGHANRQALVTYFATTGEPTCPGYTPRSETDP